MLRIIVAVTLVVITCSPARAESTDAETVFAFVAQQLQRAQRTAELAMACQLRSQEWLSVVNIGVRDAEEAEMSARGLSREVAGKVTHDAQDRAQAEMDARLGSRQDADFARNVTAICQSLADSPALSAVDALAYRMTGGHH